MCTTKALDTLKWQEPFHIILRPCVVESVKSSFIQLNSCLIKSPLINWCTTTLDMKYSNIGELAGLYGCGQNIIKSIKTKKINIYTYIYVYVYIDWCSFKDQKRRGAFLLFAPGASLLVSPAPASILQSVLICLWVCLCSKRCLDP